MRRCYEHVNIGDALSPLRKGPLTSAHLMRWSAAMENWHKIHYDRRFAVEHDRLPGILVNGTLKQQFIRRMTDHVYRGAVSLGQRAQHSLRMQKRPGGKISQAIQWKLVDMYDVDIMALRG